MVALEAAIRRVDVWVPLACRSILTVLFFVSADEFARADSQDPPLSQPPALTWAGLYMGLNFGGGIPLNVGERFQAGSGFTSTAFDLYPPSRERSGVTFGVVGGYGWQFDRWAIGVGGDLNFLDGRGGSSGLFLTPPAYWPLGVYTYTLNYAPNAKYFASFRTRVGYAFDRTLVYVTGGVAAGGERGPATLVFNPADPERRFVAETSQSSRMKYILGAGLEYAFADEWSARVEYFFLSQSLNTQLFDNGSNYQYFSRARNETNILRFGLNRNFGPRYEATDQPEAATDGVAVDGRERFSAHGQSTIVAQGYPKFPALYSGANSFPPNGQARVGSTTNLFLGMRLWEGAGFFVNPELEQGCSLANSVGAASFVNVATAPVGRSAPYMRFQRYFLRQVVGLSGAGVTGGDSEKGSFNEALEATQNQLAGPVDKDRLTFTLGKFAVGDVFDDNVYAHDPTTGFLNLSFNGLGAFDYAADAWGYTYGAALEWKQDWWSLRGGAFQLASVPHGPQIEPVLMRQYMGVAEVEGRYELWGQPGKINFLLYGNNAYLSKVEQVVALAYATQELPPSVDNLRKRRLKIGGGVNIQQQLMPGLGLFLRASLADPRYQYVAQTNIDRGVSTGLVASGKLWGRPEDEIGVGAAFSSLSGSRVSYYANGGIEASIGDGALSYDGERALEAYYKLGLSDAFDLTFDYQLIANPGYNAVRGPVNVLGIRVRAGF